MLDLLFGAFVFAEHVEFGKLVAADPLHVETLFQRISFEFFQCLLHIGDRLADVVVGFGRQTRPDRVGIRIALRPMAVSKLPEKGRFARVSSYSSILNGRIVEGSHLLCVNEEGFSAQSVKEKRKVEAFVSYRGSETIVYLGLGREPNRHLV